MPRSDAGGHREGDADRKLPPLKLEGAHVVRRDGDLLSLHGPVEHPGEDRVPEQPGDDHPRPVADALGDVAEGDDRRADLEPEDMGREASLMLDRYSSGYWSSA